MNAGHHWFGREYRIILNSGKFNKMTRNPLVSIIVTTKNEQSVIARLLKSLQEQSYRSKEVIIVDNHSDDDTVSIARRFKARVFNWGPERSSQRNYGALKAKGEHLLFLDADMKLTKNVVAECVREASISNKIGAVVIPERSVASNFWERVKAFERSFYNLKGDKTTDAARFFTTKAFKKSNGYDESITGPEDWDLPERIRDLGFKEGRIKSVIYHHERIPSLHSIFRKKYYYGLRVHRYLMKHRIPIISAKTVYFLRPIFLRNWSRLILNPVLSIGLVIMMFVELIGGGLGFLIGKWRRL